MKYIIPISVISYIPLVTVKKGPMPPPKLGQTKSHQSSLLLLQGELVEWFSLKKTVKAVLPRFLFYFSSDLKFIYL